MTARTERNHTGVDSSALSDDPHRVQILLIRHGLVVEDVSGLSAQRSHLSRKGRTVVRDVGQVLQGLNLSLEAIVVSPMVATVQTAELLAERLDFLDVVEVLHSLGSGIPSQLAAKQISQRGSCVAVVGQEPSLSMLGAFLTARPAFPPLRPGQVSVIEDGQPLWFIHPETLEQDRLLIA